MAQKSYRLRFQFWLDITKDFEERIAACIEVLKEERQFSRAIREGLALWLALRERDISLLLELHPWIVDRFQNTLEMPELGNRGHDNQVKALQAKIETLTELVLQKEPSDRIDTTQQKQLAPGDSVENRHLPKLSDDLLEIKAAKADAQNNSSYNFMIASAAQVYGSYDALPPEIIAYGFETGRIPKDKVKLPKVGTKQASDGDLKTGDPKAIAGTNVTFTAPSFDDDTDLLTIGV